MKLCLVSSPLIQKLFALGNETMNYGIGEDS